MILAPVFMRAWQRNRLSRRAFVPRPDDAPMAQAPGADPDRVLLLGTDQVVGWGVRTHDLALTGYVARELSSLTGRGAQVETVAEAELSMGAVADLLVGARAWRYDAVVVTGGMRDAVSLTSVPRWRTMIGSLIERLESETSSDSPIVMLGIPPATSTSTFSTWPGLVADRQAMRLNAETEALCAPKERVRFSAMMPPSERPRERGGRAPWLYRDWARAIAEVLAPALSTPPRPSIARARRALPEPEAERQQAVDASGIVASGRDARFDRIALLAKDLFHSEIAAVTVIDNHRQWYKSIIGLDLVEVPRTVSFCDQTIAADGPLIFGDLSKEHRFDGNPFVQDDPRMRFYAGYPIESPDGYRIGALCVMDSTPRDASTVDTAALRELALLVQRELWSVSPHSETHAAPGELTAKRRAQS